MSLLGSLGYPKLGPRPPYPALGRRPPAPIKISTSATSSYLKSSHYVQLLSMVYRLIKACWRTHVTCTCFKETALLFNVHLNCFVDFILCPTDKYMLKVNNKKIRLICWMCSKLKINTAWQSSGVFTVDFDHS